MFIKSKHLDDLAGGGGGDFFQNFEMKRNLFGIFEGFRIRLPIKDSLKKIVL